ncbi:hypothetical protein [Aliarcobacter butzleri]|uniref:hypothetical protein n=1 Tax=Aliarcobacter butzleri TaxID=28197 RepID=UPI0021B18DD3|nr:hypothetical protein [Aliarcobacter butzleri]MCT7596110.1 hypothetical protein [Aliarcobacter butzleri]
MENILKQATYTVKLIVLTLTMSAIEMAFIFIFATPNFLHSILIILLIQFLIITIMFLIKKVELGLIIYNLFSIALTILSFYSAFKN